MIVVDLDGTILDGRERHHACYRRILESFGAEPLALARYWELKRSRCNRRTVLGMSGVEDRYSEFMTQWLATIESAEMLALDRVHPGALEALGQLRANGHRLALVTSRQHEGELFDQLAALGLRSSFDHVVVAVGAETGVKKAAAYTDSGLPAACSAWIGDTEVDIEAARVLGAPSFAVCNGLRTRDYLASLGPAFVDEDLADLVRNHTSYPIGPKT